jgi:tRNA G18 (ribose-2'-O)-methylase SpoU
MNKRERHDYRTKMLTRYRKQRQRNLLAQPGCHDFILVLDNLKAGYNVPKIFRSAQAFGTKAIHLINIGPFDPAPGKGAFKQVPAHFHETFEDCYQTLDQDNYTIYTLEPENGHELGEQSLPKKSVFIFGHEEQ